MLELIYERLRKNPDDLLYDLMDRIPRSDVYHVTHHVNALFGTNYSYKEMETIMREEGCFEQGQDSTHKENEDCTPNLLEKDKTCPK